jgi:predicted nucleic acid binding AN1-type Zn finger protein
MMKYQPKKTTKMTQKKAIAYICKQCQEVKQLDKNVQHCTAFWGEHKQCPLHPFRMGKNYWSTREVSEETIRKMREARNQNSR